MPRGLELIALLVLALHGAASRVAAQRTRRADASTAATRPTGQDSERKTPPVQRPGAFTEVAACRECHEEEAEKIRAGFHKSVPWHTALQGCETCHGPGRTHVDEQKASSITFPPELPRAELEALCARCHADQMREHGGDPAGFAMAGKACTACHKVHRGMEEEPGPAEKRRFSRRSELNAAAVPAGGNECVSCHPQKEHQLGRSDHASLIPSIDQKGCETCHGNGSLHVTTVGVARVITRPDRAADGMDTCRGCHPTVDPIEFHWKGKRSPLLTPGLNCTSCHQVHVERRPRGTRTDPHTGAETDPRSGKTGDVYADPYPAAPGSAGSGSGPGGALVASYLAIGQASAPAAAGRQAAAEPAPARFAGNRACVRCHEPAFAVLQGTIHESLAALDAPPGGGCEACHAGGAAHAAGPGHPDLISSLRGTDAKTQAGTCLACHGKERTLTHVHAGSHQRHDVGCLACHSPAAPKFHEEMKRDAEKACGTCHPDVAAEFRAPNHHRVPEGAMYCSDCHDAHGGRPKVNDLVLKQATCEKCHREYAGPFVFEHQAQRTDGCVVCHVPHGSTNPRMLREHRTQQNCLQCHGDFPAFHDQRAGSVFTNCLNCHTEVHGSNTSRFFFR